MSIELKIKSKHLALEPKIIRHEEHKLKKQIKYTHGTEHSLIWKLNSLCAHRCMNVRNEARATHLARTFIDGKPYCYAERKRNDEQLFQRYIVPRILAMVQRYGKGEQRRITVDVIKEWSKLGV